jgi:predicted nucleic acid-binding protein
VGVNRGLLDTSVLIAAEQGRPIGRLPREVAVSVITLGELEVGVEMAPDADTRSRRGETLALARRSDPLPITENVMGCYARLVRDCRRADVRAARLDALIAATAIDHGIPVVTQDQDFDAMAAAHPSLHVMHV